MSSYEAGMDEVMRIDVEAAAMYKMKMVAMASVRAFPARFGPRDGRSGPWQSFWASSRGAGSTVVAAMATAASVSREEKREIEGKGEVGG